MKPPGVASGLKEGEKEEEDGGGKDEHTRAEEVEEQPAVPRKIRCVRTESSPGPSTQI